VKFMQKETLHLMGEGFSTMGFDIFADGKPTRITRVKLTKGSPKFELTLDEFACGDETYNMLGERTEDLQKWLERHVPGESGAQS
jgi:hypothetical protein